eukprot:c18362_g1_i1 orf=511-783(+)
MATIFSPSISRQRHPITPSKRSQKQASHAHMFFLSLVLYHLAEALVLRPPSSGVDLRLLGSLATTVGVEQSSIIELTLLVILTNTLSILK